MFGNSLIASDHIIDVFRERFVERFGNGGRGFVLVDRMAPYGPRTRTGIAKSTQWNAHNFSMGDRGSHPFGVSGVVHVSNTRGARTLWRLSGERRARIYAHDDAGSPPLQITLDGQLTTTFHPTRKGNLATIDVDIPPEASQLVLEAEGAGAAVYGALLEGEGPGVSINTYGVPAAGAAHFLAAEGPFFADQLRAQDPALVVVMLGGNETKRLHWKKRSRDEVEQSFVALLALLQRTVPRAACLAVSPIDAVHGGQEKSWQPRAQLSWVIDMQRRVAAAAGCAYFDLYRAMGGEGSLKRFHDAGFLHDDMVHPKSGGLDILGELMADALLRAYEGTPRVDPTVVNAGTLAVEPPSGATSDG
ncbi:MAG: GDSL-type esterase/lipase family protein [Myxococcota bacterium]